MIGFAFLENADCGDARLEAKGSCLFEGFPIIDAPVEIEDDAIDVNAF